MKRLFFIIALAIAATTTYAQMYLAGTLGFGFNGGKQTTKAQETSIEVKTPSTISFQFTPSVGYYITDKFLIGGAFNIGTTGETDFNNDGNIATKTTRFSWAIVPYARYKCVGLEKFGVWMEGAINLGGSTGKTTTGNITTKLPYTTSYGINFYPVLTYDLTERLTLETGLRILALGFNGSVTTEKTTVADQAITNKTTQNGFTFAAGGTSDISIGISFKL